MVTMSTVAWAFCSLLLDRGWVVKSTAFTTS